jgi:predicted GH43/DUF377 family glycosyl hydrolase
MRWTKLGRIFCPVNESNWMVSHAANCVAIQIGEDRYRIYFSTRDVSNRASIGWIEIDIRDPENILEVSREPALSPGPVGAFDDSGVSLACVVIDEGIYYLYYTGWNLGVTVPWRNSIGLAVSQDGLRFERYSPAPILDRNRTDPFSLSYPFVLRRENGWKMWYGSNLSWGPDQRDMKHVIKFATGSDAMTWSPTGAICVGIDHPSEYAFSRPFVINEGQAWKMWYSYRGEAYRIGYAESADGVAWNRLDSTVGIEPSDSGWDSESIEYPWLFDHGSRRYMLYNGNRYGLTGFGLAVLNE